ncbi:MAG: hypothetical protein WC867_05620 [Candidatus Pacearchaeota archaeon]|jgi:hypothetical protein
MRINKSKGVVLGFFLVVTLISISVLLAESDLYSNDKVLSLGIKPKMKILTPGANNTNTNSNITNNTNNSNNNQTDEDNEDEEGYDVGDEDNYDEDEEILDDNDENDNENDESSPITSQESSSSGGGGGSSGGSSFSNSRTTIVNKYDDSYDVNIESEDVITLGKKVEKENIEKNEEEASSLADITGESIAVEDKQSNPIAFFIIFAIVLGAFLLFLLGYTRFHTIKPEPIKTIKKVTNKSKKLNR